MKHTRVVSFTVAVGVIGLFAAAAMQQSAVFASSSDQAATKTSVTFTKEVAPILQEKCQVCHQPNSIGPMSLISYADAKDSADEIKEKVSARLMPPWHIDRTMGIKDYKNDRGLTDAQVSTIVNWVDAGAGSEGGDGCRAGGIEGGGSSDVATAAPAGGAVGISAPKPRPRPPRGRFFMPRLPC